MIVLLDRSKRFTLGWHSSCFYLDKIVLSRYQTKNLQEPSSVRHSEKDVYYYNLTKKYISFNSNECCATTVVKTTFHSFIMYLTSADASLFIRLLWEAYGDFNII